ncbi:MULTISPECIES: hypothetical protein [Sphingomonas]|jgi:hypothetical protein
MEIDAVSRPINILLQTTILPTEDDWHIGRFSMLRAFLENLRDETGQPLVLVTARDREVAGGPDPVLATLDTSSFDELWLFAVDTGDGLDAADCEGITRFRARGGGLLVTRDHMNLGSSVCALGGVGLAHQFHSVNLDPDASRQAIDDIQTSDILWPNYHSGANGDFQEIEVADPPHPLLTDPAATGGVIRYLPAHPHEGSVGVPTGANARVIARGTSKATGRRFNLIVAFEPEAGLGPAVAESSFHHFADYNLDPSRGCPSFVSEAPGHALQASPGAMRAVHAYVANLALWLAGRTVCEVPSARRESALDEALDESFPASDPPAIS